MGANDGFISTGGLVIGVVAATVDLNAIATAGIAGLVAGAVSMALGEYVSVSTQRDTESALIEMKRNQLKSFPDEGRNWLVSFLHWHNVSEQTSSTVIREFGEQEVLRAHLRHGLGIDEGEVAYPLCSCGIVFAVILVWRCDTLGGNIAAIGWIANTCGFSCCPAWPCRHRLTQRRTWTIELAPGCYPPGFWRRTCHGHHLWCRSANCHHLAIS